ncbi:protein OCTOPUS-like [Cannabis sativa]|uniref:protein OCTOPUS-like n=1 Tax=Cannabis sativa TaxID=3483 RepID=UPI0029C9D7E2|nr:protein OCTOPUS-like [Cannabis sativa]
MSPYNKKTGFCASCLREHLVGIESFVNNDTPTRNQAGSGSERGLLDEGEIRVSKRGLLDEEDGCELRPMKEFTDLECKKKKKGIGKDLKDIAGTFWVAASGLSKKLRKWGRKPKGKKLNNDDDNDGGVLGVERCSPRHLRETQSEVGDYGLGRRSCDTDPRLSMDAGRMSLDEYRYSFDEPRASGDGYLIGRAAYPRLTPMVSVVEGGIW